MKKPGIYDNGHDKIKIRDNIFLKKTMRLPEDWDEKIFVSWDSIIPEDRAFIEACKYYATFQDRPDSTFLLSKRGSVDPSRGTIKGSLQEDSFYQVYANNLNYLRELAQKKGKNMEWQAEVMDLAVQYQFQAAHRFLEDFSTVLDHNNIIRILPTFSKNSEPNITKYRKDILEAWNNMNKINKQTSAKLLPVEFYSDFDEIFYKKSAEEMMKIYSMPIFGENPDGYEDGPEL